MLLRTLPQAEGRGLESKSICESKGIRVLAETRHDEHGRPLRSVRVSEERQTHLIMNGDINGNKRLFGGRLLEWIDQAAAITAMRHSGMLITTASIDNLQFLAGATVGELLVIEAKLTYVGKTSMEIRVDTYIEERANGIKRPINKAYLTEVCIDDAGKPVMVPYGISVNTEEERIEYEGAIKRLALRKDRRQKGI